MVSIPAKSVNGEHKKLRSANHDPRSRSSFTRSADVETFPIVNMFFSVLLLSYALLASTVLAVPNSRPDDRIARRVGRRASPLRPADAQLLGARKNGGSGGNGGTTSKTATVTATTATATSSLPSATDAAVITSSIWGGAGLESPANTYQSVTGELITTFRVVVHNPYLCCRNSRCPPPPARSGRGEYRILRGLRLGWSGRHDLQNEPYGDRD